MERLGPIARSASGRWACIVILAGLAITAHGQEQQEINRLIRAGQLGAASERVEAILAKNPKDAKARFLKGVILSEQGKQTDAIGIFQSLTEDYPELPEPYNNLASLFGYFDRPDGSAFAQVLADIAADGPGVSTSDAAALGIPTLVVGNTLDALHPLSAAHTLATAIPGATFVEITSKALDSNRHFAELRAEITTFLHTHFKVRSLVAS